jgi:DNA-binding transcriptional MerR regulator
MKIGELVKQTGVSKESIHHYIREGLVSKAHKKGKNVAAYDEGHLEQILLIKELRDNYFLPLPLIKKIIRNQKKLPNLERFSFQFQNQYFRPVERFFPCIITGRAAFQEATGLTRHWLQKIEEWQIITPKLVDQEPVYSKEEVTIGQLIRDMDKLGFGPRDGHDPEILKILGDHLRETLADNIKNYLADNLDKLASNDLWETANQYSEVLSLFIYHLLRKTIKDESLKYINSIQKKDFL